MEDWSLPEISSQLCNQCGICVEQCPAGAVEMGPEGPFFALPDECTYCAECETSCPQGAIACTFEIVWGTE